MLENVILSSSNWRRWLFCPGLDTEPRAKTGLLNQGAPFWAVRLPARTEQLVDCQVSKFVADDFGEQIAVRGLQQDRVKPNDLALQV